MLMTMSDVRYNISVKRYKSELEKISEVENDTEMKEDSKSTGGHDSTSAEGDAGKYRMYASLSFAVLLLGVGVPLWWRTTTVPRVSLPYSEIDRLGDLSIRIRARIVVATLERERGQQLAGNITAAFRRAETYDLAVASETISADPWGNSLLAHHELEKAVSRSFKLAAGDILLLETNRLIDSILVGSHRAVYFSPETTSAKLVDVLSGWTLRDESLSLTRNALTEPTRYSLDEENRRRFPASPAYDVLLTLVNPEPEKLRVEWDLQSVARRYIEPFLHDLSIMSNFSVKSQWLYLLPLDVAPKRIPDSSRLGRHYALAEDVLPQLLTPLEKKLASQVSPRPCINLVVYFVPCENAPLRIYTRSGRRSRLDSNVDAFLSARWGGVVLTNPPSNACEGGGATDQPIAVEPEETAIVGTALSQLRLLVGMPQTINIEGVAATPTADLKLRDWEVDGLLRVRSVEQLTSAKLTLQSLAQLLKEIGNIVITDVVGERIKEALRLVKDSASQLERGNLVRGFLLSKEAFVTAEAAFSDPSLLALLYFPEDQKYAVYIPLFLPAMIPVLLSLEKIYRYFFQRTASTNGKTKADNAKMKFE